MQGQNDKIKIFMAITKGFWGGAQEYVFSLATGLPKNKYDISVICGKGNTLPEKLEKEGVKTFQIDNMNRDFSFFNEIVSFFKLIKILRSEKPDVLHLNSSKVGGLGALAGRITGVPKIIFTVHGLASNEDRNPIIRKILLFFHWITILLCHKAIVVSRKTKSDLDKLPFISQKVFVVHNGIPDFSLKTQREALDILIQKTGSKETKINIGTISELHRNKGLDFLILACKNLPENVSVYIIGEGQEKEKLVEQINELGLKNKIHLTGRIENAKNLLRAFDIFTLTSRTEALPYTILEAGMAGIPVIASRVGGIPEIIENGKSGIIIKSGDISEIERALKYLIEREEKRHLFGQNLKMSVEQNFSLSDMIHRTEKFYL